MVSYQGTYEFFDNRFTYPEAVYRPAPALKTYPKESVMGYLERHHPKFAFLVKRARLDWNMADTQFKGTVFVPREESIVEAEILNMDINTARKIVKYHFMIGLFPKNVLYTSPYQQLQSTVKGSYIWAMIDARGEMYLNFTTPVLRFDIFLENGIIHHIGNLLFENASSVPPNTAYPPIKPCSL